MSDLVFFRPSAPVALADLAKAADSVGTAPLPSGADPGRVFRAIAALDRAGPEDVSAFLGSDDSADLVASRAGVCFVAREHAELVPAATIGLIADRPEEALLRSLDLFHPGGVAAGPTFERRGIDPAAIVHSDARLEQDVTIDPGAVVGPRVEIGAGTTIGANAVIGAGVRIGRGCIVESQVSIRAALIGDRVRIHAGARIGLGAKHRPDLGRVIVQDDVEIGANSVIERGRLGDTMIGERAKIPALSVIVADRLVDRQDVR